MNECSSRSHTMLTVYITSEQQVSYSMEYCFTFLLSYKTCEYNTLRLYNYIIMSIKELSGYN